MSIPYGTLQALNDVVSSYLRENEHIVYAHKHNKGGKPEDTSKTYGNSAFNYKSAPEWVDSVQYKGRSGWACNCTTFAYLCLMGVPFNYSAYNRENNTAKNPCGNMLGRAGYCFNIWGEDITSDNIEEYYNTQRMYKRFKEMGLGEPINADYTNVSAGDVVWFSPSGEEDNIGHVGIVMATHNRFIDGDEEAPVLIIAHCTSAPYPIKCMAYTSQRLIREGVCYVGHPVYQTVAPQSTEMLMAYDKSYTSFNVTRDFDLYNQEIVTLECDYTPTKIGQYIKLYVNGIGLYPGNRLRAYTECKKRSEIGVTQHLILPMPLNVYIAGAEKPQTTGKPIKINKISINCINSNSDNNLKNLRLYKGFKGDIKKEICKGATANELYNSILKCVPKSSNRKYSEKREVCVIVDKEIEINSKKIPSGCYYGELHSIVTPSGIDSIMAIFYGSGCQYIISNKNNKWNCKIIDFTS